MQTLIREHRDELVAIGEVGLDHWKVQQPAEPEPQRDIFRGFVRLAAELGLPLNIHSRSAGRHVIALLLEEQASRVQLHAFDGKPSRAQAAVEAGYYFSIPAPRTPTVCIPVCRRSIAFRHRRLESSERYPFPRKCGARSRAAIDLASRISPRVAWSIASARGSRATLRTSSRSRAWGTG